jgi:hypothetical protein
MLKVVNMYVVGSSLSGSKKYYIWEREILESLFFDKLGAIISFKLFDFKLFISYFDNREPMDFFKGVAIIKFLTGVNTFSLMYNMMSGKRNYSVSCSLSGERGREFFFRILDKAKRDEEFRLNLIRCGVNNGVWQFVLRDFSSFFDLSKLAYDFYNWKRGLQVSVSFKRKREFIFLVLSAYGLYFEE